MNRTAGYEDFLIWDDGLIDPIDKSRKPPSNWVNKHIHTYTHTVTLSTSLHQKQSQVSQFQGSAWQWNEQRQQYYLRQFSEQQPDLNYRNPAVMKEMSSVLTFWLDKGVDGFRVDALPYMMEADKELHGGRYPDDPLSYAPGIGPDELGYTVPIYSKDQEDTYDIVIQWRALLDEYSKKDGITRYSNRNIDSRRCIHKPRIVLVEEFYNTVCFFTIWYIKKKWLNEKNRRKVQILDLYCV